MTALARPRPIERLLWPLLTCALFLALWHLSVTWSHTTLVPGPVSVEKGVLELARKGVLWAYIADSLGRVALGFGAAVLLGVPLGLALGWYPAAAQVVNPTLQILRPISPIAWIPVAIVLFGVGNKPAIFLIFMGSLFPIVVACTNGVATVPTVFRRAGRNFGLTSFELLTKVIFPASLPQILIGLRLAFGIAWLVVVAAEMVAVNSGLGYLVIDSRNAGKRYDLVVAAMLLIGLIGLVLDLLFRQLEKLGSVRWGFHRDF